MFSSKFIPIFLLNWFVLTNAVLFPGPKLDHLRPLARSYRDISSKYDNIPSDGLHEVNTADPSMADRIAGRSGMGISNNEEAEHEDIKQAGCKPDLVPIKLPKPSDVNTEFHPSCVRLLRCGGCCASKLSCQPTKVKERTIQVKSGKLSAPSSLFLKKKHYHHPEMNILKIREKRSPPIRRSRNNRARRDGTKFESIDVVEHLECECQCNITKNDCNHQIHIYDSTTCKCNCRDKTQVDFCGKQSDTHIWNHQNCKCVCKDTHLCSSGQYFSHRDCRCENAALKPNHRK